MEEQGLASAFAAVLQGVPVDAPEVRAASRLLLIDGLAVAVAGARERGPAIAAGLARRRGGDPVATVIGHGFATSAMQAAQVNGMAMHVLDFEPMWSPPNHAVSPMLPALLAKAEERERAGAPPQGVTVLRAIARGVEAQGRLRVASGQIEPHGLSFHPPGVVGPLATALAVGDLLGLDTDRLAMAVTIAASCGAGLIGNIGSMTKAIHCGNAAARGVECAELAAEGFTGNADALSGPRGYGHAYFGAGFDPAVLTAPIGTPRILEPGMAWKLFPSQYATHFAITAGLDCRRDIADPAEIVSVSIVAPPMAYIDRPRPDTGLAGKFSFQYGVAAALLDARVDLATFAEARRFAPDMAAMLARISLTPDESISGRLDQMHVDVRVTLRDGRVVEKRCDAPEGSWSRRVPPERIETKARDLLAALPAAAQDAFWTLVEAPPETLQIGALMQTVLKL